MALDQNRIVPAIDTATVEVLGALRRQGFDLEEIGEALLRWGSAVLGALNGMEATAERLHREARDFTVGGVMQAAIERAQRSE